MSVEVLRHETLPPPPQLKLQLDSILLRELTVDDIATYAEDVIHDLLALSKTVTDTYIVTNPDTPDVDKKLEDSAFRAFGFPLISELLDQAQEQDERIKTAGSFIVANVSLVDTVITPPDEHGAFLPSGADTYKKPGVVNRLQTLLYIVQELGVDLDNVTAKKGPVPRAAIRDTSYITVEIPHLERVAYVCDEEDNASYIFDSAEIDRLGLTVEELDNMTKKEKNQLIKEHPELGRRFLQGPNWASRLELLLTSSFTETANMVSAKEDDPWMGFWTNPEDGKHFANLVYLARKLGIGRATIERYIDERVAHVRVRSGDFRWKESVGLAYEDIVALPEIQKILAVPLTEREGEWAGFYQDPDNGHHIGIINALEKKLDVRRVMLIAAADRAGLSPVQLRSATRHDSDGYDYEALLEDEILKDILSLPATEKAGEWKGFWTDSEGNHWGPINALRAKLGVHPKIIKEVIGIGGFNSIRTRNGGKPTDSYCLEDLIDQPKIVELNNAPAVEADGEWQGFYTDPKTGYHWAPLRTISDRLGTHDRDLRRKMEGREIRTTFVRVRGGRGVAGVHTAYCIEQIQE